MNNLQTTIYHQRNCAKTTYQRINTPAPDNREETAPVMGERAFYN